MILEIQFILQWNLSLKQTLLVQKDNKFPIY